MLTKLHNLSRRAKITMVVAAIVLLGITAWGILLYQHTANKPETKLREAVGTNTGVDSSKIQIQQVVATKDGWTIAAANTADDPDNLIYVIYQTGHDGKITIWDTGTGFDLYDMTDAGIPVEVQAAALGVSVDDAKQQIAEYQAFGRPVTINGLDAFTDRGVDSDAVDNISSLLSSYFNNGKGNPHPAKQISFGPDIGYYVADDASKTYTGTLTVDGKTQKQLVVIIGDDGLESLTLADADGSNPDVLTQSNDD